jgi:FkbM family methyltransferase
MIFDIGSNVGSWTTANINSTDKIISIEASPSTFQKLKNTHQNNPKVVCLNYAVCNNNNKDVTFYECVCDVLSSLNKDWFDNPSSRFYTSKYNPITVPSITIDSLIKEYGVPELVKIDVEGGEFECVSSLTFKVPQLCFEWASETNDITFKCLDYLYNLGFREFYVQYIDNYTFRPTIYNSIENVKEELSKTTPKDHWGMLWCK